MSAQDYSVGNEDLEFRDSARRWLAMTSVQLFVVLVAVALAYGHTLDVPLYFDDYSSLRDNPAIRDWTDPGAVYRYASQRFLAYYTFALNYGFGRYDVFGYHLVNTLVHFFSAATLYFFSRALLNTPAVASFTTDAARRWLPLAVALLFALHPLQTQAVTYIVQRAASMAALFFLISMYFYVRGRLTPDSGQRLLSFGLCALAGLLAVFSKQNAVVLPLALFLVEVIFFRLQGRRLLQVMGLGAGSVLLLVGVYYFAVDRSFFASLDAATQETELVGRFEYLAMQMGVIWTYILKFFLPYNLHLEYDVALTSFASWKTLLFAAGHLALLAMAVLSIRKRPMLAFGILFYYTAHLVESSIIPIRDFAFEHRTYLPNVGLCLVLVWGLLNIAARAVDRRGVYGALAAVLLVFGVLTWLRNDTWRDPIEFYTHETTVSPNNLRPWSMLGENYLRLNRNEEAAQVYTEAQDLVNTGVNRRTNTELAYFSNFVLALERTNRHEEALALLERIGVDRIEDRDDKSLFLMRRGVILAKEERFAEAEQDFIESISLDRRNVDALINYGKILLLKGEYEEARRVVNEALEYDPVNQEAAQTIDLLDSL